MKNGKIYIIPTRFGIVFLFGIIMVLLAGAIYANNLVNMLAFFLLAIALVSMVQTHNNLKNVALKFVHTDPGFADDAVGLTAALENSGEEPRFSIEVRLQKDFTFLADTEDAHPLHPRGSLRCKSSYSIRKRGRHAVKRLRISSVYPVGLFYAWMYFNTEAEFLVYPARAGSRLLPNATFAGSDGAAHLATRGGEDFRGHRTYVPGDPANRIDWKAYARGRSLLVKEFDEGNPDAILLDWDHTPSRDIESKLSQLTLWLESAYMQRRRFALRLPNDFIPPGEGLQHYEHCLEKLAVYPGGRDVAST